MPADKIERSAQLTDKAFENIELHSAKPETDKNTVTEALVNELAEVLGLSEAQKTSLKGNMALHTERGDYINEVVALHAVILPYLKDSKDESERKALAEKIFEGAKNCTEGYLNRLGEVHLSISYVFDIPHILQAMRHSLVEKSAANVSEDVHVRNRFFKIGNDKGLGLLSTEDKYSGDVGDEEISIRLESIFMEDYKPFAIMGQVYDELLSRLRSDGYQGAQNESYHQAQYDSWKTTIDSLLPELKSEGLKYEDYFITKEDEDNISLSICDLRHDFIRKKLFEHLNNQYFSLDADLQTVMRKVFDTVDEINLSKEEIKILVNQPELHTIIRILGNEEKQQKLIQSCMDAADDDPEKLNFSTLLLPSFPCSLPKLAVQPVIDYLKELPLEKLSPDQAALCLLLASELDETKQNNMLNLALRDIENPMKQMELLLKMLSQKEHNLTDERKEYLKNSLNGIFESNFPQADADNITIMQHFRHPDRASLYLKAAQVLNCDIPEKFIRSLLSNADAQSAQFLVKEIEKYDEEKQKRILTPLDKSVSLNPLMIAAKRQPDAVRPLMEIIKKLPQENQVKIFKQTDELYMNALMLATKNKNNPNALQSIIEGIKGLSTVLEQAKIFQQQDTNWENALEIALSENQQVIPDLLKGISHLSSDQQLVFLVFPRERNEHINDFSMILEGRAAQLPEKRLITQLSSYPGLISLKQNILIYYPNILIDTIKEKPNIYNELPRSLQMDSLKDLSEFYSKEHDQGDEADETRLKTLVVKDCISKLTEEYEKSIESKWYGAYSIFSPARLTAPVKKSAADKIIKCIEENGSLNDIDFTEQEIGAINDGRLGHLWSFASSLAKIKNNTVTDEYGQGQEGAAPH